MVMMVKVRVSCDGRSDGVVNMIVMMVVNGKNDE